MRIPLLLALLAAVCAAQEKKAEKAKKPETNHSIILLLDKPQALGEKSVAKIVETTFSATRIEDPDALQKQKGAAFLLLPIRKGVFLVAMKKRIFSLIGVFWLFMLTGTTFSFMASIGIMILIGVVVNNGIVLIDHVNNLRREGMPRNEALLRGARDRLRPIVMTVATTILGMTPLAVGTTQIGGDGPPYFPMARAIIGGLAFSTVTSLFVAPSVYVWFDGLSKWWRKVLGTARGGAGALG